MQGREHPRARLVRVHLDVIVVDAVGREQADDAPGGEQLLLDDALEHRLGVVEELGRFRAGFFVLENGRVAAFHLPGNKERRPVDVARQFVEGVILEDGNARFARRRRRVMRPIEFRLVCPRLRKRQQPHAGLLALVPRAHFIVVGLYLRDEIGLEVGGEQVRCHTDTARGVLDPDHGACVIRRDLHRRVHARGGGAADEQRDGEARALHLFRHMRHFIERGRDEAGEADEVHLFILCGLDNLRGRHHHAEIDDLIVVAREHHAHDVLADVVHVALHGGHEDLALGLGARRLLRLDERHEMGHGLLHDARALHHLRQEHLAGAEEIAHHVHAVHERAFDHLDRARELFSRLLRVPFDIFVDALHERVLDAFRDRRLAPGQILGLGLAAFARVPGRDLEQPFGGIGAAIQDHVLDPLAQLRRDLLVHRELAGVHDAHIHAGLDRVVQEHRVDRLAHRVVAAERERHVGHAAGDERVGEAALDLARGLDEVHGVVVVLLDAGCDREDVRVEDDVLRREAQLLGENPVRARADFDLALPRVGLAVLVESHDHHGRAVAAHRARLAYEFLFAFLEADRVHDRLALNAFEARLEHAPFGGVNHDRHARDLGLGGDEVQERRHRLLALEHRLVHVDVDHLRATHHLAARDLDRLVVLVVEDELLEDRRAGDVGALADVHEHGIGPDIERLESRKPALRLDLRHCART